VDGLTLRQMMRDGRMKTRGGARHRAADL